jgi:hypothetical protein
MRRLSLAAVLLFRAADLQAWPTDLVEHLSRDARRLVPKSLARLLAQREDQILEETRRFPAELAGILAADLSQGVLQPETLAALEAHGGQAVDLIRQRRVSEGLVRLGSLLRVPADLSDPVLSAGPEGYPPGVVREYYAYVGGNLEKIPVVLEDAKALELTRGDLPHYWQSLLGRSRTQSPVIRIELFRKGRLVSHKTIDYRSPVYGVASLSYSRAVTAIAATWLAFWRDVKGDLTRRPEPAVLTPRKGAPDPLARPRARGPLEARKP